jgi:hypothetical protein
MATMMHWSKAIVRRWARNGVRLSTILVWAVPWARPVPPSTGDQVILPTLPGTSDAVVVARGRVSPSSCVYDRIRKGQGTLDIGQLLPSTGCASDVLLFAKGVAMQATAKAWSTGNDLVTPLPPPGRVVVEYHMILVAPGPQAAQQAGLDTVNAIRMFNRNRVGITFHASSVVQSNQLGSADVAKIGDRCDKTALDNLATATDLYDSKRLNVYFVPGTPGGWRGRTCWTMGYQNVTYISIAGESPGTLAHELGHALGLQDPLGRKLGHTGVLSTTRINGFVYQNLMWTGLYDQEAAEQRHFSIGQAYRMNMDKSSWLIVRGLVPGRVGPLCHPLVPEDSIPCPMLALDTTAALP